MFIMDSLMFDFDKWAMNNIVIGKPLLDGNTLKALDDRELGYAANEKDGYVTNLFFCLNSNYRGYKQFKGYFRKNKKKFELHSFTKQEDILKLFGNPVTKWDDGSEINIQFVERGCRIEFSWGIRHAGIELDYMIVELERETGQTESPLV